MKATGCAVGNLEQYLMQIFQDIIEIKEKDIFLWTASLFWEKGYICSQI